MIVLLIPIKTINFRLIKWCSSGAKMVQPWCNGGGTIQMLNKIMSG